MKSNTHTWECECTHSLSRCTRPTFRSVMGEEGGKMGSQPLATVMAQGFSLVHSVGPGWLAAQQEV